MIIGSTGANTMEPTTTSKKMALANPPVHVATRRGHVQAWPSEKSVDPAILWLCHKDMFLRGACPDAGIVDQAPREAAGSFGPLRVLIT